MANVQIHVTCPCGALLMTRMVNPDSRGKTNGQKKCSSCKENVKYQLVGANSFTSYVK